MTVYFASALIPAHPVECINRRIAAGHVLARTWEGRHEMTDVRFHVRKAHGHDLDPVINLRAIDILQTGSDGDMGTWTGTLQVNLMVEAADEEGAKAEALSRIGLIGPPAAPPPAPENRGMMNSSPLRRLRTQKDFIRLARDMDLVGRSITGIMTGLGSYGSGGAGWTGLQIDQGAWIVIPIWGSKDWIWIEHELFEWDTPDEGRAMIERRIMGAMPDQTQWRPWQMNFGGHDSWDELPDIAGHRGRITRFEITPNSLSIETTNGQEFIRYMVTPNLAGPPYPSGGRERLLDSEDDLTECVALMISPYMPC